MELKAALAKAGQILDEERSAPTVSYEPDKRELGGAYTGELAVLADNMAALTAIQQLADSRLERPRPVQENPRVWAFKSVNYTLLCALHSQITADFRTAFVDAILVRMVEAGSGRRKLPPERAMDSGSRATSLPIQEFLPQELRVYYREPGFSIAALSTCGGLENISHWSSASSLSVAVKSSRERISPASANRSMKSAPY